MSRWDACEAIKALAIDEYSKRQALRIVMLDSLDDEFVKLRKVTTSNELRDILKDIAVEDYHREEYHSRME